MFYFDATCPWLLREFKSIEIDHYQQWRVNLGMELFTSIHWNQVIENFRCNKFSVGHPFTEIISHCKLCVFNLRRRMFVEEEERTVRSLFARIKVLTSVHFSAPNTINIHSERAPHNKKKEGAIVIRGHQGIFCWNLWPFSILTDFENIIAMTSLWRHKWCQK